MRAQPKGDHLITIYLGRREGTRESRGNKDKEGCEHGRKDILSLESVFPRMNAAFRSNAFGMLFVYDEPCSVRRNARKNIRKKDVEADITRRLVLRSMRQIRRRDSRAPR